MRAWCGGMVGLVLGVVACSGGSAGSSSSSSSSTSSSSSSSTGGSSSSSSSSSSGSSSSSSSSSSGGAAWQELVAGDWSLPSGTEGYKCVQVTIPDTIRVAGFRPVAPQGTHHTVLTTATNGADRVWDCNGFTNGPHMLFGSGLGTTALEFPTGVAITLTAGTKILLNLHLFNTSPDSVLTGRSGIEALVVADTGTVQQAQTILMGTENIALGPGATTLHGGCAVQGTHTVFAVFPHMHQTATHMKVTLEHPASGAASTVLMDDDYTFDAQTYRTLPTPLVVSTGDHFAVDCSYVNETGHTVTYGESSTDEMCYAGVYFYPPIANAGVTCTE